MRRNSDFAGDMRSKNADAFHMISSGGMDSEGNSKDLEYFSKNQPIATKDTDLAALSSDAMRRMLSPEQAQKLLNSTDLDVKNAITDPSKSKTLTEIASKNNNSMPVPHDSGNNITTNIGTAAGPDSVSE